MTRRDTAPMPTPADLNTVPSKGGGTDPGIGPKPMAAMPDTTQRDLAPPTGMQTMPPAIDDLVAGLEEKALKRADPKMPADAMKLASSPKPPPARHEGEEPREGRGLRSAARSQRSRARHRAQSRAAQALREDRDEHSAPPIARADRYDDRDRLRGGHERDRDRSHRDIKRSRTRRDAHERGSPEKCGESNTGDERRADERRHASANGDVQRPARERDGTFFSGDRDRSARASASPAARSLFSRELCVRTAERAIRVRAETGASFDRS